MYGFYKRILCVRIKTQFCSLCLQKENSNHIFKTSSFFARRNLKDVEANFYWSRVLLQIHPSSSILHTYIRDDSSSRSLKDWCGVHVHVENAIGRFIYLWLLRGSMGLLVLLELYISWLETWLRPFWFYLLLKFHWHQPVGK